ncbi:hypothetical protein AGMMS4952_21200 [Spirochaetia bacterium]|nr:hypothetical protein AGMMS4952_21200 [Spirochaetia bacterium]
MKQYFIFPTNDVVFQPDIITQVHVGDDIAADVMRVISNTDLSDDGNEPHRSVILVPVDNDTYDFYDVGTYADVLQSVQLSDKSFQCTLKTRFPVRISNVEKVGLAMVGHIERIEQIDDSKDIIIEELRSNVVKNLLMTMVKGDQVARLANIPELNIFIHEAARLAKLPIEDVLGILQMKTFREKLASLIEKIELKLKLDEVSHHIDERVREQFENGRKEAYLQEKIHLMRQELGEDDDDGIDALKARIDAAPLSADAREKVLAEWKRLKNAGPHSGSEIAVIQTWLDEVLAMPWGKTDKTEIDLAAAKQILDEDHCGMDFVKERILEHLAVMKRTNSERGAIMCLVGSPGVGKTSLGKSVARALGRAYSRISLGGVSDEALFRGHRKTYIGSMPGRIMDALKRAKTSNPVIVLDEIDKLGRDYRGDPEAALLEVLDPEQNKTFRDNYLEVDFDLSGVMFIATANALNLSPALKDRMEIIQMSDYVEDEKINIARKHLLPQVAADTGWDINKINITDDVMRYIIREYTNEAGVRNLRRQLAALLRAALYQTKCETDTYDFTLDAVQKLLRQTNPAVMNKIGFRASARNEARI